MDARTTSDKAPRQGSNITSPNRSIRSRCWKHSPTFKETFGAPLSVPSDFRFSSQPFMVRLLAQPALILTKDSRSRSERPREVTTAQAPLTAKAYLQFFYRAVWRD